MENKIKETLALMQESLAGFKPYFIERAIDYRAAFPKVGILHVYIVANRYVGCNRIRASFPPGIGDTLSAAGIQIDFVVADDSSDIVNMRGKSGLVAFIDNDVQLVGELKRTLYNCLQTSLMVSKAKSLSDLIIRMP